MSPAGDAASIETRKGEHLRLAAQAEVDLADQGPWRDVRLVHQALPEMNLEDVDLGVTFVGHRLRAPLLIAGMTGGHPEAEAVNAALAAGAARYGLALGV